MHTISPFRCLIFLLFVFNSIDLSAQSAWPSQSWTNANNLTSVMDPNGVTELSGLFWNGNTRRLLTISNSGHMRALQYDSLSNSFSMLANKTISGDLEGITQVNLNANEFYIIDESNYQIKKYTHQSNYSNVTLANSWNIVAPPSPMTNTGNTGPEGITFIPDSFLNAIGFISQSTGLPYTSVKGMGGLIFVANQDQGYIWVFDVNPAVTNDFAYVGKYQSNKTESCDLAFDRSTGLLYILHNVLGNSLEVTNLGTTVVAGGLRKFVVKAEYTVANPVSFINIEGFAITSTKCADSTNVSAWLCRDVSSSESSSIQQDCLRWFHPFNAPGSCNNNLSVNLTIRVLIQGFYIGNGTMKAVINPVSYPTLCDTIVVELHQQNSPHALVSSVKGTINTSGVGNFAFPEIPAASNYYIVIRHRNALETWSSTPVIFNSAYVNYTFADNISKAYQNQLSDLGGGNFALFSGDVDQNGNISDADVSEIATNARVFLSGYKPDDITGDGFIESSDFSLVENNYRLLISVAHP